MISFLAAAVAAAVGNASAVGFRVLCFYFTRQAFLYILSVDLAFCCLRPPGRERYLFPSEMPIDHPKTNKPSHICANHLISFVVLISMPVILWPLLVNQINTEDRIGKHTYANGATEMIIIIALIGFKSAIFQLLISIIISH